MFEAIKARLRRLTEAPKTIPERAAPRIEAQLKKDATTRRGNIPSFAPGGPDVPITARAVGAEIKVNAVDWVLEKAAEKGQHEIWADIVRDEARKGLRAR